MLMSMGDLWQRRLSVVVSRCGCSSSMFCKGTVVVVVVGGVVGVVVGLGKERGGGGGALRRTCPTSASASFLRVYRVVVGRAVPGRDFFAGPLGGWLFLIFLAL